MDKKRLNSEEVPQIKQGEIDAWLRGKGDAVRNQLLAASQKLTPRRAVKLVETYAQVPDVHFLSTRFDIAVEEVRNVLAAFSINSVEDARAIVNSGVIKELNDAEALNREVEEKERRLMELEAQERLIEQQATTNQTKTSEEIDAAMAERREAAQRKNKEDRLRQLIAEGLDSKSQTRSFRIPLNRVAEFKRMIPYGVFQMQRVFGGSEADIVSEIKRLAPEFEIDMLRP